MIIIIMIILILIMIIQRHLRAPFRPRLSGAAGRVRAAARDYIILYYII